MRSRLSPDSRYQVTHAMTSASTLVPALRKRTAEIFMRATSSCRGPGELTQQQVAQRLGVQLLLERSAPGERDGAALLRDEDRERVGLLRDPDRRAMARAEPLREPFLERQRKEARGRGDAVSRDDDRAVVQRRPGSEQRHEQLVRN